VASNALKDLIEAHKGWDAGPPARPGFTHAMKKLMETPGASSDDLTFTMMPRRAGKSFAEKFADEYSLTRPKSGTTTATTGAASDPLTIAKLNEIAELMKLPPIGKKADLIIFDEVESEMATKKPDAAATATQERLELLVVDMNEWLNGATDEEAPPVVLFAPESLTVETATAYAKMPHIGGESFTPVSAYLGKRGKIIVKFKPEFAAEFTHMEMSVDDACKKLNGFSLIAESCVEGGLSHRLKTIMTTASSEREREAVKDKFAEYADIGFGSW
jgi:hypothetical protein